MKTYPTNPTRTAVRTTFCTMALSFLAGSSLVLAQEQPPAPPPEPPQQQDTTTNGGWRKATDPPPAPPADANPRTTMDPNYAPGPPQAPNSQYSNQPPYNPGPIPPKLTLKPGTFVTVRLNQMLSSDHNQTGDAFAATLAKPLVIDGIVVAERGQTVGGHVVEAKKAGRVEGTSRLQVQLTDLTLSDGHPVPVQSQLISLNGPTSVGRDVAAVGATTAAGAAIGAAAGWGRGAAIGAGAGAAVGLLGVLLTRGRPTVLYPEEVMTFRIDQPVTISTEAAPQAFRWVNPNDYDRPYNMQTRMGPPGRPPYGPGYPYGYPYAYSYPYAYGYPYPYVYPYLGFGWGWGGYYGRGFYGRGWGWRR